MSRESFDLGEIDLGEGLELYRLYTQNEPDNRAATWGSKSTLSSTSVLPNHSSEAPLVSTQSSKGSEEDVDEISSFESTYGFQTYDKYLKSKPSVLPPLPQARTTFAKFRFQIASAYRRLFSVVFLGNVIALICIIALNRGLTCYINACTTNLALCGLARLPHVTNQIYKITTYIPRSAPLWLRCTVSRVSHYGGFHSGCGIAALFWYIGTVGLYTFKFAASERHTRCAPLLILQYTILLLLLAMVIAAFPKIRAKYHDYFEFTHRFAAWTILASFWAVVIYFAKVEATLSNASTAHYLAKFPTFYLLILITITIIVPWLSLRRVPVIATSLSDHATRLHFSYTHPSFSQGISISRHPLRDWHAFAAIPYTSSRGFSLVVSAAGDWTTSLIRNPNPPTHLWKRNIPACSFLQTMLLFKRCLLVTTGSGIGPCLSLISAPNRPPLRILWSTRSPMKTYGKSVLDDVQRLDPNAMIIDTSVHRRQDMLPIAWNLANRHQAEAVFVVARRSVVKDICLAFEARGVPAFGPVFDS
jgi:hypothetical protein